MLRGTVPPLQLLSASQERSLWEQVLRDLGGDDLPLAAHASGLIRAAARANQSLLTLSRSAISEEEQLLVRGVGEVRQRCAARGLLALRLAPPEALQFLREVKPPAIVGEPRLTALQEALRRQCWGEADLLLPAPARGQCAPSLRRFANLEAELAACAEWCLEHLRADGSARLLILSACSEPSLPIQAELLWQRLAGAGRDSPLRDRLLSVEGGTPLDDIGLIASGLLALECLQPEIDTEHLYALLRSPYFQFGSQGELWSLQGRLERWALARWSVAALLEALAAVAGREPAAERLLAWLKLLREEAVARARRSTSAWALRFNEALAAAGFNRRLGTDSREQQRFDRWAELLDEFSGLDAVLPVLGVVDALDRLRALAAAGRHEAASGDAAVTFGSSLGDPVIDHDGIWVLGLAESRWPAPPRPDAYVAVQEQRAHHWPEASAAERRQHADWALSRWQRRTGELILSYPQMEGDLHHRPTALPGKPAAQWASCNPPGADPLPLLALPAEDQQFPAVPDTGQQQLLRGGVELLRNQQQCPFRAQAQWRLAARAPGPLSDGLTAIQRGTLLHALLQAVWGELQDQASLQGLAPPAEQALLERHWNATLAGGAVAGSGWWSPALRERERERTLRLVADVLQLERERAPFKVVEREVDLQWPATGPRLKLRVDRIDRTPGGEYVLIDYKSGAPETIKLQTGELAPLQLALYVTALAARGVPVTTAALLSLQPDQPGFSGVAAATSSLLPGMKAAEDWNAIAGKWQQQLAELLGAHLAGSGALASDIQACRYCHLPALCRRAAIEDLEDADE